MPPKTRITKELIIEKSFEITKSEGIENLNARYLAKQLNCSTMPIFKVFNEFIKTRSIEEVVHSAWNRETLEYSAQQFGITIKESEILYRDIRFYTHGIATQIYGGNMALKEEEIQTLLKNAINKFLK